MSTTTAFREQLKPLLRFHEGKRQRPYLCSAGRWTVGVGHNFESHPFSAAERAALGLPHGLQAQIQHLLRHPLTDAQIDLLLDGDLEELLIDMADTPDISLAFYRASPVRRLVLADMAFNLGVGGLQTFRRFLAAMRESDYDRAADHMVDSRWFHQVGPRAKRLVRMMREDQMPEDLP